MKGDNRFLRDLEEEDEDEGELKTVLGLGFR